MAITMATRTALATSAVAATATASKQEALEEHYRPSTHGKSCRAKSCDQLAPSPTYTHATPLVVYSSLCLRALL